MEKPSGSLRKIEESKGEDEEEWSLVQQALEEGSLP